MRLWEYKALARKQTTCPQDVELLNPLGEQGWELVSVFYCAGVTAFYLKREKCVCVQLPELPKA